MRIYRHTDTAFADALHRFNRRSAPSPAVQATVAGIIAEVRQDGDAALHRLNERFSGPAADAAPLRVEPAEFATAAGALDARTEHAMAEAHENVRAFAHKSLRHPWHMHNRQGVEVGERFDPFPRVGIYVPGGTAPLVSTAIMTCTLAQAAGVPDSPAPATALSSPTTPPTRSGSPPTSSPKPNTARTASSAS